MISSYKLFLALYPLTFPDNKQVPSPSNAISAKENLKLDASAINPIMGGPTRKPRNPMVETAESAMPGVILVDLPAKPYAIGTTDETPKPTSRNPIVAEIR